MPAARPPRAATGRPASGQAGDAAPGAGGGHRLPDLSGLPPLLAATGTFAALRERLGAHGRRSAAGRAPRRARRRAARRQELPGGGDRPGRDGRAAGLDRARRRDRRPRRRGAGCLAGRCRGGRRPRAADRARLRTQRAHRRRDRSTRRGPGGLAERPRTDPRGERPGAPPAHDRSRRPPDRAARAPTRVAHPPGRPAARAVRPRLCPGQRGRRARRIGAAGRHRRRLPAVAAAADPDRVLR